MSIASYLNMQSAVGHLLSLLGKKQHNVPFSLQNSVNFIYDDEAGRTGIDIRSKVPSAMLNIMADKIRRHGEHFDTFIMVTPYVPNPQEVGQFYTNYQDIADTLKWLTVDDYAREMGLAEQYDLASPSFQETLKAASVAAEIARPSALGKKAPQSRSAKPVTPEQMTSILESVRQGRARIPMEYVHLARKMPPSIIRALMDSKQDSEAFFSIGSSARDAIIVLTDIKNFSPLVRAAAPQDLNEALSRYYREAKRLIDQHGGVLDKFMGDSVLAVFNYPLRDDGAYHRAMAFAANIILLGRQVLGDLQQTMDEKIDVGTRVGVASGEIWVLNIGLEDIDLTFVGDKINLAARLEKQCETNGILLSNIARRKLAEIDPDLYSQLDPARRVLHKTSVKGQESDILSWQVSESALGALVGQRNI
ncbi:MAG: adenylate/guanylate cyclase domain-containing protein [Oceanidesulfovibrio sp.]